MIEYDPSVDLRPLDENGDLFANDGYYIGNVKDKDFEKNVDDYYEDSGLNDMLGLK